MGAQVREYGWAPKGVASLNDVWLSLGLRNDSAKVAPSLNREGAWGLGLLVTVIKIQLHFLLFASREAKLYPGAH